jgi:hypothetical protein
VLAGERQALGGTKHNFAMDTTLAFRTSSLFEADQFAAALDEKGIPYFRRMDAGGVEQAMPAAPAEFFGTFWSVYVPVEMTEEAKTTLEGMPFDSQRDEKWQPTAKDQRNWRRFVVVFTVTAAVVMFLRYCA